ncbi:MAG: hypothetical protein ACT4NL_15190 [Pseudomarimonas sp.]
MLDQVAAAQASMTAIEGHLSDFMRRDARSQRLQHASGVGRITKRGDVYLRTLLIHGARPTLVAAKAARTKGPALDRTQQWALHLADRLGLNKAAVALGLFNNRIRSRLRAIYP